MTLIDKAEAHDDDLIRRGDVLREVGVWLKEKYGLHSYMAQPLRNVQDAIAALPARGVGVDAVAVKNAVMGWVWAEDSDVSKRLGPKHTDALIARILAALAPTDAPNLADPVTVHANMLRGTIAKPTVEQIIHLYGVDTLAKALAPVIVREAAPYMTDLMVDPETIPDMEMEYDHRAGDDSDD